MDFIDEVKVLAAKIPGLLGHIKTEAGTRTALVEPFIRALGYDTSDPTEVVPEFGADLNVPGVPKNKKIDYGILKEGKPIILIECKCHTDNLLEGYKQLFHYAVATDTRIAILTNGVVYRFYADLDRPNRLDESPFLELDMLNLQEPLVEEIKRLTKPALNVNEMLTTASELKYVGGILGILTEQLVSPLDENFAKFFFQRLCPGKAFAGKVRVEFSSYTQRALKQFVREQINKMLDATDMGSASPSAIGAVAQTIPSQNTVLDVPSTNDGDIPSQTGNTNQIVTTAEELEGFYIVKSILREVVDPSRVVHRDVLNYFGILLDDNNRKPICRLYFNNLQNKKLALFDHSQGGKEEQKVSIENLNDIYQYADQLKAAIAYHDKKE